MRCQEKQLTRLAIAIHERLQAELSTTATVDLPMAAWQQSETVLRKMRRARQLGWHLAARRLQHDLRGTFRRMQDELIELDRLLVPKRDESNTVSVVDIHAELVALHEEFREVSFDRRKQTLSVTTEPIELDGISLGPFEIRLDWGDLEEGNPQNYRVIALDANPAATNDSVTHPHVQDEVVCEGAANQPICNALEQGRLLDFFGIVTNLLRTYNSDSPFVPLSAWYGVECADCGTTICDDEQCTCEKCEAALCGECYFSCIGCDGIFCTECVTGCEECYEKHCGACGKRCSRCRAELCLKCLDDKERCPKCYDQEKREESDVPIGAGESCRDGTAVAPLQSDRLGETAVST